MTERETVTATIFALQKQRDDIAEEIERQYERLSDICSQEFIAEYGVTRDKIELGSFGGTNNTPLFADITQFRQYINNKTGDKKPFVEWSGFVHETQMFMDGKLGFLCRLRDVKE